MTSKYGIKSAKMIDVRKLFLQQSNPRHDPMSSDDDVIEYLCTDEQVLPLAKDIVDLGLNPLELFGLVPLEGRKKKDTYEVAEGNRRLCAIKLLNDPDLAPPKERDDYYKLAESWTEIKEVFCVIFDSKEEVKVWVDRIHLGQNGGIGRRQWNAEQKTRNAGGSGKNTLAQTILDIAMKKGLISEDQRSRKLSTAQRFLSNPKMREALGIELNEAKEPQCFKSDSDFDLLLGKFVGDMRDEKINTRFNSPEIIEYSRKTLSAVEGLDGAITEPRPLGSSESKQDPELKPKKPKKPSKLRYNEDAAAAIAALPSYKLEKIYYSICAVDLATHTPLITVGLWSLLETLTTINGKSEKTNFHAFLANDALVRAGLPKGRQLTGVRKAIERIMDGGNTTKHHLTSANFGGEQLASDFETIQPVIVGLAQMKVKKS